MDFFIIPPLSDLSLMNLGDRFFCLAHLYVDPKNEEYRQFFKQKRAEGKWVTLDNGAAEESLVTPEILLEVCQDLRPNEVIAPDIIGDGALTIENATKFHAMLQGVNLHESIQLFFCPQGKDKNEWLLAYMWALNQPYISTIGWSKIAIPSVMMLTVKDQSQKDVGIMESRHLLFDELVARAQNQELHPFTFLNKPIHLLGAGDPREFAKYKNCPSFRSSDSCFSVWSAMNDLNWEAGEYQRVPTPYDYFEREVSNVAKLLAKKNVATLRKLSE